MHGFSGEPSSAHELVVLGAKALKKVMTPVGGVLTVVPMKIPLLTDGVPRFFLTRGLDLKHTEVDGLPVRTFTPPAPTGKVVVAIHGGSYVGEATIFHWWTYADIARRTGAALVVPGYTLSPAGTASTEVPRVADFLTAATEEHGAANVSVLGDSAGGGLALLAVQELVRRGSTNPGRLVLLAPWLDVTTSDARCRAVDDPLLDVAHSVRYGQSWAGDLETRDPLVSPLFGSLDGLPPTVVYSSSRDLLCIDALRLRERVLAEGISQVTFRLRNGLLHDYAIYVPLPDARSERPNLYRDLDL